MKNLKCKLFMAVTLILLLLAGCAGQNSGSTEGTSIPTEYLIPQEPRIDREGLRKALRAGADIEGCKLGSKLNIQIK